MLRGERALRRALAALLLPSLLAGCAGAPPEEALRAEIAALQAAIESRDASAVADVLAEDFIGDGGMDRDAARRLATLQFMQRGNVGVVLGPLEVQMHGDDRATVEATVALAGGSGRFLPDSGRVHRVRSGWRTEGGEWRLASASWSGDR